MGSNVWKGGWKDLEEVTSEQRLNDTPEPALQKFRARKACAKALWPEGVLLIQSIKKKEPACLGDRG